MSRSRYKLHPHYSLFCVFIVFFHLAKSFELFFFFLVGNLCLFVGCGYSQLVHRFFVVGDERKKRERGRNYIRKREGGGGREK